MRGDEITSYQIEYPGGISSRGKGVLQINWPSIHNTHTFTYALSDLGLVNQLNRQLAPIEADLIDIGVAIEAADRLCLRGPVGDQWPRCIQIQIPVRCSEVWQSPEISRILSNLLTFMSDDNWDIDFVQRISFGRSSESQLPLPTMASPLQDFQVTLFSGGLDSLCGLMGLTEDSLDTIIPVTIGNNPRIGNHANRILNQVSHTVRPRIVAARAWLKLFAPSLRREPSARLRSVQFLLTGLAVVSACEGTELTVCENGYGALNLSATSDQFGSRAGKGMHPTTLSLISRLASLAFCKSMIVNNRGFAQSKGQMLSKIAGDAEAVALAKMTNSCERHTYLSEFESCGICGSCVLRQIAFHAAGIEDDRRVYKNGPLILAAPNMKGQFPIMRFQAGELRHLLSKSNGFSALSARFPELIDMDVMGTGKVSAEMLVGMLQVHVEEVDRFAERLLQIQSANIDYMTTPTRLMAVPSVG